MDFAMPLVLWLPPALAAGGVVVGLVADALERRAGSVVLMALGLLGAAGAGAWLYASTPVELVGGYLAVGGGFTTLPALVYALAACSLVAGYRTYAGLDRGPAMAALVAFGAVFAHTLIAALDLIVLFVSLSGLAVVAYGLVSGAGTRRAEESVVRYVVQGVVATGLTVYGLALVVGLSGGETRFVGAALSLAGAQARPALLALGFVVSAFAFKLGAFPFHAWVPDVYETADRASTAFIASGMKVAATVALLLVVRGTVFQAGVFAPATNLLMAVGLGSLVFGALGMLRQKNVGRLLGYSGIAQVGYALLAIAAGESGVRATVVFIVTYAVAAAASFITLAAIGRVRPAWDGTIAGLGGLSRRAPLLSAALAVTMLSLTGIPLFAGFWGKLYVFLGLIDAGHLWIALAAGVAAVVSFGGYGAVVKAAYFDDATAHPAGPEPVGDSGGSVDVEPETAERGGSPAVMAVVLALVIIAGGVAPLVAGVGPVYSVFGL